MPDDCPDLSAAIGMAVHDLLANDGFLLPLHLSVVASNGAMLYVRYDEGAEALVATPLSQSLVPGGFLTPINIMIIDSRGEAGRVLISGPGKAGKVTHLH